LFRASGSDVPPAIPAGCRAYGARFTCLLLSSCVCSYAPLWMATEGAALPIPPAGGGVGKPDFPTPLSRGLFSADELLNDRSYAVAFRRGGVEGRRPSTNRLLPARGGRAVGVAPGRLAAAGGNRGMRGGEASPHPLHHVSPANEGCRGILFSERPVRSITLSIRAWRRRAPVDAATASVRRGRSGRRRRRGCGMGLGARRASV